MRIFQRRSPDWRTQNKSKIENYTPAISLIIATYNEETTLPRKFQNLIDLDYPPDKLELVFVDSGSTDKTCEYIENFIKQNPQVSTIFICENERFGKSHALNIAYPKATGSIKIISDADAILERSALRNIVQNFSNPAIGAVCGRQVLLNPDENSSTLLEKSYRGIYEVLRQGESALDSTPIFHGELSAYRSDLIDPLPENKSADDSRLANVIRQKGYRSVYDASAVFYEFAPPNGASRRLQKVRRGQGLIRVFWDCRRCLFNRKYGKYGTVIFPMEFFMHSIFPSFFLFFMGVFLVALALYNPLVMVLLVTILLGVVGLSRLKSNLNILNQMICFSSILTTFMGSQLILLNAMVLWLLGHSLHKWQKVDDVRKEWHKQENAGAI
jgi:cellulose synthase/poly-beta-1,6-N-acetylglucosamine synthase-like glycosyltransferase